MRAETLRGAERVRVVVIDDSPFVCRLVAAQLRSVSDLEVVGSALDGPRGLELIKALRPDVVTLDLEMPGMNGLEVLDRLMAECPTPAVLLSGVSRQAAAVTMRAIDLGAVDFVLKFTPGVDVAPETLRDEIIEKVRAASRIRVIRSLAPGRASGLASPHAGDAGRLPAAEPTLGAVQSPDVVVIGASTGGPLAVRELLTSVPESLRSPFIVVQHMPGTFTGALASHLDRLIPLCVKEAQERDRLLPRSVLVAPGGRHILFRSDGTVSLNGGPEIGGHRPSIDVAMQSAAQVFGSRAIGVVLTGMGDDGTAGMLAIHAKGGRTFAQSAESCVINGMPQRAIERGVVDHVAPPCEIARLLGLRDRATGKGA